MVLAEMYRASERTSMTKVVVWGDFAPVNSVNRYPLCALNVVNTLNFPIARGRGEITHRLYDRWRQGPPEASLQEKPSNYSKVLNAVRVWY